jgi:hypothetical protein
MKSIFKEITLVSLLIFTCLACKEREDVKIDLSFEELTIVEGVRLSQATGFVISENESHIYVVTRESNPQNAVSSERVLVVDLINSTQAAYYFDQSDFISKNAHLIDNKLIVIGGSYINTYNLTFDSDPVSVEHGLALSRFGSTTFDGELYVWGGDLNMTESHLIKQWSFQNNVFMDVAQMPTPKTWADGEIVNDKLYIFGGQEQFDGTPPNDIIYVYDRMGSSFMTSHLPYALSRTFTAKHGQLIYVAGHIGTDNDLSSVIGVYNTQTDSFTELNFRVNEVLQGNIHQIAIAGNSIYILYGDEIDLEPLSIMKAIIP